MTWRPPMLVAPIASFVFKLAERATIVAGVGVAAEHSKRPDIIAVYVVLIVFLFAWITDVFTDLAFRFFQWRRVDLLRYRYHVVAGTLVMALPVTVVTNWVIGGIIKTLVGLAPG